MSKPMTAREALNSVLARLYHAYPAWEPNAPEACILTALVKAHEASQRVGFFPGEPGTLMERHAEWCRLCEEVLRLERGEGGAAMTDDPKPPAPYETLYLNRYERDGTPCLRQAFPSLDVAGCADFRVRMLDAAPDISLDPSRPIDADLIIRSELAALRAENEQMHVQLGGCLAAAEGATDFSTIAHKGDYGWSVAYQATLDLSRDHDSLRAQLARCQEILRRCFAVVDIKDEGESVISHDCPTVEEYRAALETKP